MRETTRFTSRIAVVAVLMTFVGASAFADSRHPQTTKTRDEARSAVVARERAVVAAPARRTSPAVRQRTETPRVVKSERPDRGVRGRAVAESRPVVASDSRALQTHNTSNRNRSYENSDRGRNESHGSQQGRNGNHNSQSYGENHGKRAPHYANGRVSKVQPYNHGYRVWVHGSPYPYFVPTAYWRPGYFNVGMTIRLGGYYNASGWYDYYGDYECNSIAEQRMRGVVEDVDYRRGLIRLDVVGGGDVTVDVRDRYEHVRPGDYVVVYGNWNRWGSFVAIDVDVIDRDHRW